MQQYVVSVAATTSAGRGDASNLTSAISDGGSAIPSTAAAAVMACIIYSGTRNYCHCSYSTTNVSYVMLYYVFLH